MKEKTGKRAFSLTMPKKTGSWKEPNYKARIHSGSGASAEHRSSLETDGAEKNEIEINV